jgi:hypothetical protein
MPSAYHEPLMSINDNAMPRRPRRKTKEPAADFDAEWNRQDAIRKLYGPQDGPVRNAKLKEDKKA